MRVAKRKVTNNMHYRAMAIKKARLAHTLQLKKEKANKQQEKAKPQK